MSNVELQFYLQKGIPSIFRKCITRIRLSSHDLCIETGRYHGLDRNNRNCIMFDLNVIEDEFHFILQCSRYLDIRKQCIKNIIGLDPQLLNLYNYYLLKILKSFVN